MNRVFLAAMSIALAACGACGSVQPPIPEAAPVPGLDTPVPAVAPIVRRTLTSCPAGQTLAVLPDDADASPRSDQPAASNGTGTAVSALVNSTAQRIALFHFDASAIPSSATINSAELDVVSTLNSATGGAVHDVGAAWTEAVTWAGRPGYGAAIASLPSGTGAQSITLPVASVQAWISGTNNGLAVDVTGGQWTVYAREAPTNQPTVRVCYSVGGTGTGTTSTTTSTSSSTTTMSSSSTTTTCTTAGESTAIVSTCVRTPDTSIRPTVYPYGVLGGQTLDHWPASGTYPANGAAAVVALHGGGFEGGPAEESCPNGDYYSPTGCIMCLPGNPNDPCNAAPAGNVRVQVPGRAVTAYNYFCRVVASALDAGRAPAHCFSVDYPLMSGAYPNTVNPYSAGADSAIAAVAWIKANASTLGVDPNRILVWGMSAGGHLAAKVAAVPGMVKMAALWYPNLYFDAAATSWWSAFYPSGWNYISCGSGDTTCQAQRAPIVNASPSCGSGVPTLISHGNQDTVVSLASSQRYLSENRAAGNPTTLIVDTIGHGYAPTTMGPATDSTCTLLYGFLPAL